MTATGLMFASAVVYAPASSPAKNHPEVSPAFFAALLLAMAGFTASAALTALGLLAAFRSGMRVWIGEGVNQARTLLFAMLIVGFTILVLGPMCVFLAGLIPLRKDGSDDGLSGWLVAFGFFFLMFICPVVILYVLEWFERTSHRRPTRQVRPEGPDRGEMELIVNRCGTNEGLALGESTLLPIPRSS